tara:strand:- start:46 stop:516 length:471 start_codon:yes stop_codon:yes gene_type:complete
MNLSATEYLLILQMRSDSSLTLTTAEEDYIKGLRLEGKTSLPRLKPRREKWHTYAQYILKVKKDAQAGTISMLESGATDTQLISDASACYDNVKNLKLGVIDLDTYESNIAALNLPAIDTYKLKYMTAQVATNYRKELVTEDPALVMDGVALPDLE